MSTIIERIRKIIDYKRISERAFCKEIGVANGFMSKVSDVGCSKLNKILYTYPEFNPIWLLTGDGDMLRTDGVPTTQQVEPIIIYRDNPKDAEIMALQRDKIKSLEEQVSDLKKAKATLTNTSNTPPAESSPLAASESKVGSHKSSSKNEINA